MSLAEVVLPTISSFVIVLLVFLRLSAYNSLGIGTHSCELNGATGGYDESYYGGTRVCLHEAPIRIPLGQEASGCKPLQELAKANATILINASGPWTFLIAYPQVFITLL